MCDMEKLYRHLQKKCQYPAAYKNGQITVTLSRGEVRIRKKCAQLLLQDRLYEEFDWDETDDPDDLVKIVDNFAENLEFMGSEYNATYKAANKAAVRRCWWIPLLMLVVAMASLAMMDRTEDVYWLLAILVCPFFLLVPLVAIRRSVFHRYWVCPPVRPTVAAEQRQVVPANGIHCSLPSLRIFFGRILPSGSAVG